MILFISASGAGCTVLERLFGRDAAGYAKSSLWNFYYRYSNIVVEGLRGGTSQQADIAQYGGGLAPSLSQLYFHHFGGSSCATPYIACDGLVCCGWFTIS